MSKTQLRIYICKIASFNNFSFQIYIDENLNIPQNVKHGKKIVFMSNEYSFFGSC